MRAFVFALSLLLAPPLAHAQGANDDQAKALIAAAADYHAMPLGGLLMDRDSVFILDSVMSKQYTPDGPTFAAVVHELETCTGITFQPEWMAELSFAAVPGDGFRLVPGGTVYIGYTAVEKHNIFILAKYQNNRQVMKHEMLHALLWDAGVVVHGPNWHPPEWFNPCGVAGQ